MAVKKNFVKLDIYTREFAEIFGNALSGTAGFQVMAGRDTAVPDLLIHELTNDWKTDLEKLRSFMETAEKTDVFIVSEKSDPAVLIQALRIGVKEFLPAPLESGTVAEALRRFKERQEKQLQKNSSHLGRVIGVMGSKGGVGTTTIAVNLGDILSRKPDPPTVAIIEMNMVFGDIPMLLDISPRHHWGDITRNITRLDEFFLSNIMTKKTDTLHILPSPRYLDSQIMPSPPVMEALLELMKQKYEYIVIDLGQTINDTTFKIIQLSDRVEIVTIQTLPCLSNANRLIKSLLENRYTDEAHLSLILNRYIKKGLVTLETAEEGLGKKISWVIPNDFAVTMAAINAGQPLFDTAPKSKIVKSFEEYTDTLLPEVKEINKKKGWFF